MRVGVVGRDSVGQKYIIGAERKEMAYYMNILLFSFSFKSSYSACVNLSVPRAVSLLSRVLAGMKTQKRDSPIGSPFTFVAWASRGAEAVAVITGE